MWCSFKFRWRPVDHRGGNYARTLAGCLCGLIIDALAPRSEAIKAIQALKPPRNSRTARLSVIFLIIPARLLTCGIYSLYLLYLGLPVLMNSPPDKSLVYTIVVILGASCSTR